MDIYIVWLFQHSLNFLNVRLNLWTLFVDLNEIRLIKLCPKSFYQVSNKKQCINNFKSLWSGLPFVNVNPKMCALAWEKNYKLYAQLKHGNKINGCPSVHTIGDDQNLFHPVCCPKKQCLRLLLHRGLAKANKLFVNLAVFCHPYLYCLSAKVNIAPMAQTAGQILVKNKFYVLTALFY